MKLVLSCLVVLTLYPVLNDGFRKLRSSEININNLISELAKQFKLKKYAPPDPEKIKKAFRDLNITQSDSRSVLGDKTLCAVCKLLVKHIQEKQLEVKILARVICNIYFTLSTLTLSDFCEDVIRINVPILEFVFENSEILDPEFACSVLLQNKLCYHSKPALKWRAQVPSESLLKIPEVNHNPNAKSLKIIHLTDIHITPDYEVGGVENCGYPICCKKGIGNPLFGANAGKWGDYNCDIPPWLFGATMLHFKHTHKDIDLVYFTGDVIDHTVWKASVYENTKLLYYTFKALYETFTNVSVLPIIGNHESAPANIFAPSEYKIERLGLSTQWLYTLLSKLWRAWLPANALSTVSKQGYYSYVVNKKFKIIVLNNNICYNLNWWVLYDTEFLNEQLDFLSKELEDSERNEQFVHILTHIPVGNKECIEPWEVSYNSFVKRFKHIIKGQFYGHTHTDELKIFYNEDQSPINVGYNGGSLTPFVKYNPNYKLVIVDPNSYDILDIETYYFNLTEANLHPDRTPRWQKLYSMKEAYGFNSLSPVNVEKLARDIFKNETLFRQYWRYYVRDGDASLKDGCDEQCKKEVICKIVTTESLNSSKPECTL